MAAQLIYNCTHCAYNSKQYFAIRRHTKREHEMRHHAEPFYCTNEPEEFKCEQCKFVSDYTMCLNRHMKQVHTEHTNFVAQNETPSKRNYPSGELTDFNCKVCALMMSSALQHVKHLEDCGTSLYDNVFCCSLCTFTSATKTELSVHTSCEHPGHALRESSADKASKPRLRRFMCVHCPYNSTDISRLNRHISEHTAEKDNKWLNCKNCSYQTKRKDHLKGHILREHKVKNTHLTSEVGAKSFTCHHCSFRTATKAGLARHAGFKHNAAKDVEWSECRQCSYRTKFKVNMNVHILRAHTATENIKWYKCEVCSFRSKTKHELKVHIVRMHTAKEAIEWFHCEHCPYKGKVVRDLTKHVSRVHAVKANHKRFKCEHCPYRAKSKSTMKTHISKKHPQKKDPSNS